MLKRRLPIFVSVFVLILITLPYLIASQMNSADAVFGGFLINPADGHSYLAKMQQGFNGEWRFVLPYTAESGKGAYLFLFYILLGHLGRILGLPLIFIFHGARILGAIFLLFVLFEFNKKIFTKEVQQNLGFAISVLGSGLGWIAIFAGMFTSDFWVAEAYPFLSMYTNPHFTIGLSMMILALMPDRSQNWLGALTLGLILGIIQPFAVVIVIIVKSGSLLVEILSKGKPIQISLRDQNLLQVISFALGGGVILIYQYGSIVSDPVLSLWNDQNITESPGIADLFIALSPVVLLAGLGIKTAWKNEHGKGLVIWAITSLVLVLVPWNLQRRFLTGIYVPLAGLSVFGLDHLKSKQIISLRWGLIGLFVLALPTNMIVLTSGIQAALKQDQKIFHSRQIHEGLTWIKENTAPGDLVLANENIGLLIPSLTGRRVVYGHPFETVNADVERSFLKDFFEEQQDPSFFRESLRERGVNVLYISPHISPDLQSWIREGGYITAFENDQSLIYLIGEE